MWWISILLLTSTVMFPAWLPQRVVSRGLTSAQSEWISISSGSGFLIDTPDRGRRRIQDTHLFIRSKGSAVFLNGKELSHGKYIILPEKNTASIDGVSYDGPISLRVTASRMTVRAYRSKESNNFLSVTQHADQHEEQPHMVKVLLDEFHRDRDHKSLVLVSDKGFTVVAGKQKPKEISQAELRISYKKNAFCINNAKYEGTAVNLIPKKGFARVNGVPYHGSFTLLAEGNRILLISNVELEEYICGVLRTESWPGWPLEVNKAFAIASRSYVMAQMKMARKKKLPYHVKNTSEHQTYQGMHDSLILRDAVNQTRGIFLGYNNEPVLAMFDASCGGVIPAYIEDFDFGKAEYLKRSYPCKHCKRTKRASWHSEINREKFYRQMGEHLGIKGVKDVKILRKDKAGLVKELEVITADRRGTLTGQQFYKMFKKEVKSFHFDMKKKSDKIIMNGRGYGHHLGLCQWGAREMVRDGWSYQRILQFYYPGTQFLRLPS